MFLFRAIEVALFINQPGNLLVWPEVATQLFGAQTRGAHEVRPPMIVRIKLVFFPLIQGRSADYDDIFAVGSESAARPHEQQYKQQKKPTNTTHKQEHYLRTA